MNQALSSGNGENAKVEYDKVNRETNNTMKFYLIALAETNRERSECLAHLNLFFKYYKRLIELIGNHYFSPGGVESTRDIITINLIRTIMTESSRDGKLFKHVNNKCTLHDSINEYLIKYATNENTKCERTRVNAKVERHCIAGFTARGLRPPTEKADVIG